MDFDTKKKTDVVLLRKASLADSANPATTAVVLQ